MTERRRGRPPKNPVPVIPVLDVFVPEVADIPDDAPVVMPVADEVIGYIGQPGAEPEPEMLADVVSRLESLATEAALAQDHAAHAYITDIAGRLSGAKTRLRDIPPEIIGESLLTQIMAIL